MPKPPGLNCGCPLRTESDFWSSFSQAVHPCVHCCSAKPARTAGRSEAEFLQSPAPRDGLGQALGQFIEFVMHNFPFVLFLGLLFDGSREMLGRVLARLWFAKREGR